MSWSPTGVNGLMKCDSKCLYLKSHPSLSSPFSIKKIAAYSQVNMVFLIDIKG